MLCARVRRTTFAYACVQLIAQEAALDKFTEAEMKQATQVRGMDYKDFNTGTAHSKLHSPHWEGAHVCVFVS